jgi:hypothetical protein
MRREAPGREVNSTQSGIEAYDLEISLGRDHEAALRSALEAAIHVAWREFYRATRDDILEKAEDMDLSSDVLMDDLSTDGPASLIWYAALLDETLPPEQRLDNNGNTP